MTVKIDYEKKIVELSGRILISDIFKLVHDFVPEESDTEWEVKFAEYYLTPQYPVIISYPPTILPPYDVCYQPSGTL